MKVREGERVINVVVLVATGVNADGHREVLGLRVATSESGALAVGGMYSGPGLVAVKLNPRDDRRRKRLNDV